MSEEKKAKGFNWGAFAIAILMIAMGVLFIVFSNNVKDVVCTVLGIFLFIAALALILNLVINKKGNIAGIITLAMLMVIFGVFCFTNRDKMGDLMQIFFAAVIIYNGLTAIVEGVARLRAGAKGGIPVLVMGIILLGLGCVVLFGTFNFLATLTGIALIIDGVATAVITIAFKPAVPEVKVVDDNKK